MREQVTRLTSYGILTQDQHVLLCRLSSAANNPGWWTLPGGGIDFGESPEVALVREIGEETGLTAVEWKFLEFFSETELYRGRDFHLIRFFYRVTEFSGELRSEKDGTTDLCDWLPLDNLPSLPVVPIVSHGLRLAGLTE